MVDRWFRVFISVDHCLLILAEVFSFCGYCTSISVVFAITEVKFLVYLFFPRRRGSLILLFTFATAAIFRNEQQRQRPFLQKSALTTFALQKKN